MGNKDDFFKLYVGMSRKFSPGDKNTNEIIHRALSDAGLSTEQVEKEYRGGKVFVWEVTSEFVRSLFSARHDFSLKFEVYSERKFTFQEYRLLEPAVKKSAKYGRYKKMLTKKTKNIIIPKF